MTGGTSWGQTWGGGGGDHDLKEAIRLIPDSLRLLLPGLQHTVAQKYIEYMRLHTKKGHHSFFTLF